jgi:hypothetical protein
VTVAGRGFDIKPASNDVRVGGARACDRVVRRRAEGRGAAGAAGETTIDVRVPGVEHVGQAPARRRRQLPIPRLPLRGRALRRRARPRARDPPSGVGPAFVLSASGGRSAAERGYEGRAPPQRSRRGVKGGAVDADIRARGSTARRPLVVAGQTPRLVEVTLDDAAAYEEDWTAQGTAGPIHPARVACGGKRCARPSCSSSSAERSRTSPPTWPRKARVLPTSIRWRGSRGGGRAAARSSRKRVRRAGRLAHGRAAHNPPTVKAAAPAVAAATTAEVAASPAAPGGPGATLDGGGRDPRRIPAGPPTSPRSSPARRDVHVRAGPQREPAYSWRGAAEDARALLRPDGAGPRYYQGKWDGQKLTGTVSVDPASKSPVGTFELGPS